ncbi:MAG TPA: LolA-related protein [Dokdonella sp.]
MLAWLALPCPAAPPDPLADGTHAAVDAAAIVAGLKRAPPARTAYAEVRFSALLDRPLILHGALDYAGPGRLGRSVDRPYHERTTVADGEAVVERDGRAPRRVSLAQAPELDGFLRGFSALLGGDAGALARDFELAASGSGAAWRLTLTPRDARLARRVRAIEVDGAGSEPRCFRTRETDGDVDVLLVGTLAATPLPARPLPAQIEALCRGAAAR